MSTGQSAVMLCRWTIKAKASTYIYTHPFNGTFPGTTPVSQYQKGKTNLEHQNRLFGMAAMHTVFTQLQVKHKYKLDIKNIKI